MGETFSVMGMVFHWYGLVMGFAVLAVLSVADKASEVLFSGNAHLRKDIEGSFWWVVIFGVAGARLYHVIDYWEYYRDHMVEIWQVWNGGLGIYGAFIGGLIGLAVWALVVQFDDSSPLRTGFRWLVTLLRLFGRRFGHSEIENVKRYHGKELAQARFEDWRVRVGRMTDVIAVGLPLGQAIGRIGNFINKELYGLPSNLPWAVYIPEAKRLPGYEEAAYFHPLFWYESVWNLIGFGFLWRMVRKKVLVTGKGNYFVWYLGWYGLGRTLLEPLRIRSWEFGGVPVAIWIGLAIMGGVTGLYLVRKKRHEWSVLGD